MPLTGQEYGLQINTYIDERRDPYKSSRAAAEYLKKSFNEFGDWMLAIASYNCGAGAVRRAISRSGGKMDYWSIRHNLPTETQGYVPAYVAAVYAFHYSGLHNVYPTYVDFSLKQNDTVHVRYMDITLQEIAGMTGTQPEVLYTLNPELKQKRIAYSPMPYPLRVPTEVANYIASNEATLRMQYGNRRLQQPQQVYTPTYAVAETGETVRHLQPAQQVRYVDAAPKGKLNYYTVRSGDVVGDIADKYGVSASDIAEWNNLYRYRISVGQKLRIYADNGPSYAVSASNRSTAREGDVTVEALRPKQGAFGQQKYHSVRSGDNLWDLANRYGTSVDAIRQLNPGKTSSLKPGQVLRVK
jgi:membrane-bound lytic murein transglycosylase D